MYIIWPIRRKVDKSTETWELHTQAFTYTIWAYQH